MDKNKKRTNLKRLLAAVLAAVCMLFPAGCSQTAAEETTTQQVKTNGKLSVHYMDIGQGDAALIQCEGHSMLIDAGNNNKGTQVCSYLKSQNVDKLDIAIGTHGDADHIGGLDVVIYNFDCDTIIMPDRKRDTKTWQDVINAIDEKNDTLTYPEIGKTYSLGSATVEIIAPCSYDYGDNENNYSVGVLITYGESKFLFTGDAEAEAEADMLKNGIDIDCDVFKVSHHGSSNANTSAFLDAALPEYAVISCAEGNDYGHPHQEVLNELRSRGIKVFRTDEQGTIVAVTDGKNITFNASPSESWLSGNRLKSDRENSSAGSQTAQQKTESETLSRIIGNRNSRKYHTTDCGNLPMEKNQILFSSEKEAEDAGYEKCKNCSNAVE